MKLLQNKVLIRPEGQLQILSQFEVQQLCDQSDEGLNNLLKLCALAVLSTGSKEDSSMALVEANPDFHIAVHSKGRGLQLEINNAPDNAFVRGELIVGLQEHLSSVIRDLLYAQNKIPHFKHKEEAQEITNTIFHFARNASLLKANISPNIVVCWGGHSISLAEYKYTKHVGYHLGLRGFDICTGCGPGAMKGPMKGAVLGHGKQRIQDARYIGLTEPGIISAEAPNAIVTELTIFPDIEKRLEGFLRLGHGIIIFPGGAGTMEEILYLLSVLLHPKNTHIPFPVALSAPKEYQDYFEAVLAFIQAALGEEACQKLTLFIEDAEGVANYMDQGLQQVKEYRKATSEAYYFNWALHIPFENQQPFNPTHQNVSQLNLSKDQPDYQLASQLRKAFSAIVAGNVKPEAVQAVQTQGPFQIHGDAQLMHQMDTLLKAFIQQQRMKLGEDHYTPCYQIASL